MHLELMKSKDKERGTRIIALQDCKTNVEHIMQQRRVWLRSANLALLILKHGLSLRRL